MEDSGDSAHESLGSLMVTPRSRQRTVWSRSASALGAGGVRAARLFGVGVPLAPLAPSDPARVLMLGLSAHPCVPSEDELLAVVSAAHLLLRLCSCLDRGLDLQDAQRLFVEH